jgi:HD-GYP domain-containing protein (c-di-GMP phosphodiesterase class II)
MTGASLGYTPEQLKELGAGSLLVDLGKVEISRKYNVDSRWVGTAEYKALMPEHTQLGFEQLWKLKRNTNTPYIALQHHERFDGSGFPTGLKGQQIIELARIVALADAYDTLINEGINGQKMMPHEVIEYIRDYSGSHFDPELSQVFLRNVTPFLIGSNVLLNTGEKAKVIKLNKDLLARPVIRVMMDKDGMKLSKPIMKDLVTDLTLFIVSALKDDEL